MPSRCPCVWAGFGGLGDTCLGQELNLSCAFLIKDRQVDLRLTRAIEGKGQREHYGKTQEFVPGPLRGEKTEVPEKGPWKQRPRVSRQDRRLSCLSGRPAPGRRAHGPVCDLLSLSALCSLPCILKRTNCLKVDGPQTCPGPSCLPPSLAQ